MRPKLINVTPRYSWEKAAWRRAAGPASFVPCGATATKAVILGRIYPFLHKTKQFYHPQETTLNRDRAIDTYLREMRWSQLKDEDVCVL